MGLAVGGLNGKPVASKVIAFPFGIGLSVACLLRVIVGRSIPVVFCYGFCFVLELELRELNDASVAFVEDYLEVLVGCRAGAFIAEESLCVFVVLLDKVVPAQIR